MQIEASTITAISNWATPRQSIKAVWLFGSRARGEARQDSDYDLAVELMPGVSAGNDAPFTDYFFNFEKWKAELIQLIGHDVDLVAWRQGWTEPFNPCVALLWSRQHP